METADPSPAAGWCSCQAHTHTISESKGFIKMEERTLTESELKKLEKQIKGATNEVSLPCHSRGHVLLDVIGNVLIVVVFSCSFKDVLYFTWSPATYINRRPAPRALTVQQDGQQQSADQNDSQKLLSEEEHSGWKAKMTKGFSQGPLRPSVLAFYCGLKQILFGIMSKRSAGAKRCYGQCCATESLL